MSVVPYAEPLSNGRAWLELMVPAAELAKQIANTDFVPKAMRGNPAAIAAAILYGDELGLGPMQSLGKVSVIEGRPTLAAETQRALILARGHELWLEEQTPTRVTIAGRRRDAEQTSRVTWTMDDAKRAGIAGKPNWRQYPRQMLLARASAELARALFPDATGGLAASEEFEGETEAPGPEAASAPVGAAKRRRKDKALATVSTPPAPEPEPAPEEPFPEPKASDAQLKKMFALFRDRVMLGREERLEFASRVVGRELGTSKDLTVSEASRVIDALEHTSSEEMEGGTDHEWGEPGG